MLRFLGFGGSPDDIAADELEIEAPSKDGDGDAEVKAVESEEPASLYLNLVMLNNDELLKKEVCGKLPKRAGPFMRKAAIRAARSRMSDEKIGQKIGSILTEQMPLRLRERGIEMEVNTRYVGGPLVVIKMLVLSVDSMAILDSNSSMSAGLARTAVKAANYVGLGGAVQGRLDANMKMAVAENIRLILPELITTKMKEKGLNVDAFLRVAKDQAEFFFDLISYVNAPGCIFSEKSRELHD